MEVDLLRATASDLQQLLSTGELTSVELVRQCHQQMLDHDTRLRAMTSIWPLSFAEDAANELDYERRNGSMRSPLHGIPFIVKDISNTTDEFEPQVTAGGWLLDDKHLSKTAKAVERAMNAGLIPMGETSLSEFGNWRAEKLSGGWSAGEGQPQSAYVHGGVVDDGILGHSTPSVSPSGSAVGVSAGFAPVSFGADYDGSLINPAIRAALYALRTTPGIVSEDGSFPFSIDRDSVGPMAKSTKDLTDLLNVIADASHPRVPKGGYRTSPGRQWKDISIATLDPHLWHLAEEVQKPQPGALDQIIRETEAAYRKIESLAKRVVSSVNLMSNDALNENCADAMKLIINDFAGLLGYYMEGSRTPKVMSLSELVVFNKKYRGLELTRGNPGPELCYEMEEKEKNLPKKDYERLRNKTTAAGQQSIDSVLHENNVDVIIGPADSRIHDVTALARYPSVTLPLGYLDWNGRPFGLLAVAPQFQEELLLDVARAWEATFPPRRVLSI